MAKQLREMIEKLTAYWNGLAKRQRLNLIVAALIVVLAAGLLTAYGLQKNYQPILSNLDDASAGEVISKLKDMQVDYKLQGNTIEVPEGIADQVRMELAMQNIPKSGTFGYPDLFNNNSLGGMTDSMFNAKYQAVLEGNIATTLRSINGVSNAKVQLVLPDQKLFVSQQTNDAKASVFVELRTGMKLNAQQVTGIQQLVAHSVKGLLPDNVTVIDQNGVRISPDPQDNVPGSIGASAKQLETKMQIERTLENKIRTAVEGIYGPGKVTVSVNADVSFDQVHQVDNVVKPVIGDNGVVISEQKQSNSSSGQTPVAPVGSPTQVPGQVKGGATTNSTSSSSSDTVNYDVNRSTIDTMHQTYKVNQYSVAVVINGKLTNQQKADVEAVAASTLGLPNDGSMNKNITVVESSLPLQAPQFSPVPFYQNSLVMGGIAAGALLLGIGFFLFTRRKPAENILTLPQAEPSALPSLVMEETEHQKMKKQLEKLADQKPEDFANLLRTWLVEE